MGSAVYEIFPYLKVILYSLVNTDYPVWFKAKRQKMHDAPYIKPVPVPFLVPGTINVPVLCTWVGTSRLPGTNDGLPT